MRPDAISHHVADTHFVLQYLLRKFEITLTERDVAAAERYYEIVVQRNKRRYDCLVNDAELSTRLERELQPGQQPYLHLIRELRSKSGMNACRPWSEMVAMLEEAMGKYSSDAQMSQTDRARLMQIFVSLKSMDNPPFQITAPKTPPLTMSGM